MNAEVRRILEEVRAHGRRFVTEPEAKRVLRVYGIPVTREEICGTPAEAVAAAEKIGYPVVMKLVSPRVVHKTEFDAVRLDLRSPDEVRRAFSEIISKARMEIKDTEIHGVLVSEMAGGVEMIIGSIKDPQFGPIMMFGLGGIFVEVFRDVSYRLAPIERIDAEEMISELRGRKLLEGFRGGPSVNRESLLHTMISVSRLLADHDEIAEMDLNPIFGSEDGVKVADARIFID